MRTPGERLPAPVLIVAAIASVQCGSALAAGMFDRLQPSTVVFFRLLFSAGILCALVRPKVWRWQRASLLAAVLLGLAVSGMNLVFYQALDSVPLGVGVTVEFVGPLLLALLQTRRLPDLAFAVLAAAGVGLLGLSRGVDVPLGGLVLAFVAGLFWAAYIMASARVGALLPGTQGLAVSLLVGAVVAGSVTALRAPQQVGTVFTHGGLLLRALGVALLSSVVSYSLEMTALRRVSTRVFGVLMSLEPVGATLAGLVILGQQLTLRSSVALTMVSLASVGVTLTARRDGTAPEVPGAVPLADLSSA